MIEMVLIVPKKLKRAWRKTTARRVLRGTFGSGRKTLRHAKKFFYDQRDTYERVDALGSLFFGIPVKSDQEWNRAEDVGRIAAKYSLDALNIRDRAARKRVFEIADELLFQHYRYLQDYDKNLPPVVMEKFSNNLFAVIGKKYVKFLRLFRKKYWRIMGSVE